MTGDGHGEDTGIFHIIPGGVGGAALIGAAYYRAKGGDPPGNRNGHGALGDVPAGLCGLVPAGAYFNLFLQAHHGVAAEPEGVQALRGLGPPPDRAAKHKGAQIQPAGAVSIRGGPGAHHRGVDRLHDRVVSEYPGQARHPGDHGGEPGGGDTGTDY